MTQENLTDHELKAMDLLISCVTGFPRTKVLKMAVGLEKVDDLFEEAPNEAGAEEVARACGTTPDVAVEVLTSLSSKGYARARDEKKMFTPTMHGVRALVEDVENYDPSE